MNCSSNTLGLIENVRSHAAHTHIFLSHCFCLRPIYSNEQPYLQLELMNS